MADSAKQFLVIDKDGKGHPHKDLVVCGRLRCRKVLLVEGTSLEGLPKLYMDGKIIFLCSDECANEVAGSYEKESGKSEVPAVNGE
jgi:hypothetical protein